MNIKELLSKMTLDEKLAQITQFTASTILENSKAMITGPAKAMKLTDKNIRELGSTLNYYGAEEMIAAQKIHLESDPNKIPLLFMLDVIHGFKTLYPIPLAMGATFDPELMKECCAMAAREAAVGGTHVTFGPMVDLIRDARWGRCMESTGEDVYLNCQMAKAQVEGFQNGNADPRYNVAACVKHFAAYGQAEAGRDYNTTDMSDHTLREYYLPAYRAAIDANVKMLMTAFNLLNGVPTAGNKYLINDILRGEWGFKNLVITDYHSFSEMKVHGYCETDEEVAEVAFGTSTDIEMCSSYFIRYGKELVERGVVTMDRIDESVLRILELKNEFGLFENPFSLANVEEAKRMYLSDDHREICRRAAERSAVLLKNEGVLPFGNEVKSVAVVGPFAKSGMVGFWTCLGKADETVTVYDGVSRILGESNVNYAKGCNEFANEKPDENMIKEAVEAAKKSDAVILCMGEYNTMCGEGNSRADISLSLAQKELIRAVAKANSKAVVVLFNGRALALGDVIDDANAFMTAWMPGTEGGNAVANLIFGREDFTGRLPVSFPYHTGQCPIYYNHMMTGRPKPDDDSKHYGYCSNYIDSPNKPLFPFGYGLCYTKFEMSAPVLSKDSMTANETITVKCTVKNVGDKSGVAMPELYIRDMAASQVRPVRELKGYKKITLSPGEEAEVKFEINEPMLRFHTASGKFDSEAGGFRVWVSDNAESGNYAYFKLIK